MSYDPCGTQRLEGDEIIKRLAIYLGVEPKDLENALKLLTADIRIMRENAEKEIQ